MSQTLSKPQVGILGDYAASNPARKRVRVTYIEYHMMEQVTRIGRPLAEYPVLSRGHLVQRIAVGGFSSGNNHLRLGKSQRFGVVNRPDIVHRYRLAGTQLDVLLAVITWPVLGEGVVVRVCVDEPLPGIDSDVSLSLKTFGLVLLLEDERRYTVRLMTRAFLEPHVVLLIRREFGSYEASCITVLEHESAVLIFVSDCHVASSHCARLAEPKSQVAT